MKVKAAVVPGKEQALVMQELELDEPRPGEVLVRLVATGVCHTDAIVRDQWYEVPLPAVLGHEGAGIVERVGAGVAGIAPGDHVVLSFASCGLCTSCMTGHPAYCLTFYDENFAGGRSDGSSAFTAADGSRVSSHFFGQSSFAEFTTVSARSVVKVTADVPLEILGPLGCGISTGAGTVLNVLKPEAGSSVAVFGAGAVGMASMLAAVVANAGQVVVVDVVDSRLERARELGATHTINGRDEDPVARIKEITGGGANYAVDSTGNSSVFRQMSDSMGVLGHAALVSSTALGTEATIDIGTQLLSGQSITMVVEGDAVPQVFIPALISLYQAGRFPFEQLIERYDFDDINTAFADSERGVTLKPVVVL